MGRSKRNRNKKSQGSSLVMGDGSHSQKKKKMDASDSSLVMGDGSHSQEKKKMDTLIEQAVAAFDSFNYDEAESKLQEVLNMDPNNTKSLEMLSGIFIEKFKWQEAQDLLKRCIEIEPESGYRKYFSMGQLSQGLESVKYYEKGIQLIVKKLENSENIDPSEEIKRSSIQRSLSDAYCSIVEIFMTDCCDEVDAEEKCCTAIDLAIKSDPTNPDAYRCRANFQLAKGEVQEAKESVQKSLSLWLPQFEGQGAREIEQEAVEELENVVPAYDSRIEISKLLIELEMYYEASNVLEGLLEEDDEVIQVWYLLGWLNYLREGDEYKGNAHFYLRMAKEVSDKLGENEYVEHINELLEELIETHPLSAEELAMVEEEKDDESDFSTDDDEMET